MVSLIDIAGTDESFLVEGDSLAQILDGYNKYAQATSIYNEFNSNLPPGFLDTDFDDFLASLAQQSVTPAGPSYVPIEDTRGDGEAKAAEYAANNVDTFDYTKGDANRFLEKYKILGTGVGGFIKGIFNKIMGNEETVAEQDQKLLSDAVASSYDPERTLSEGMIDISNLEAGKGKYSGVGTAFLGVLTGSIPMMFQGLYGHRGNTETQKALDKNFDDSMSALGIEKPDGGWKKAFDTAGIKTSDVSFSKPTADYSASPPPTYTPGYTTSRGADKEDSGLFNDTATVTKGKVTPIPKSTPISFPTQSSEPAGGRGSFDDGPAGGGATDTRGGSANNPR